MFFILLGPCLHGSVRVIDRYGSPSRQGNVELCVDGRRLSAEKDLSDVADVIGIVRYRRSDLCTSDSIDLYVLLVFMASHSVCTDVTFFTIGKACLMTSAQRRSW